MLTSLDLKRQELEWHDHHKVVLWMVESVLNRAAEAKFENVFVTYDTVIMQLHLAIDNLSLSTSGVFLLLDVASLTVVRRQVHET